MALATALPSDLSLGRTVTLSGSSPAGFNIFLGSLWPCPYLFIALLLESSSTALFGVLWVSCQGAG